MKEEDKPIACSECFNDRGLKLDAEKIGVEEESNCPNCGITVGRNLSLEQLGKLAYRFFVWGSLNKCDYGAAPIIQMNEHQKTDISVSTWLKDDVDIFERLLGIGFFHYGPRLWMIGEVEPLKALQNIDERTAIIDRILNEYPSRILESDNVLYRLRKNPKIPSNSLEYDSPPKSGGGRLDTAELPILYASPDLQVCVHECRISAEDDVYVATLRPQRPLKLLDLSALLVEDEPSEFESLDMAIHMLFLAGEHSYEIEKMIASSAYEAGFDGIVYPSYFSILRLGVMPFQTAYGISLRMFPQSQESEQAKSVPNLAIFGHPIKNDDIAVECINRLILNRVQYDFHFGPVDY